MRKNTKLIATCLLMIVFMMETMTVVNAAENSDSFIQVEINDSFYIGDEFEIDNQISIDEMKEKELDEISTGLNLTEDEKNYLRDLYKENKASSYLEDSKLKVKVVKKIARLIIPVAGKALKAAGVKITEKSIADVTDFLFEWEGPVQDGLEQAFVNIGAPRTVAHWVAKAIMFVLF